MFGIVTHGGPEEDTPGGPVGVRDDYEQVYEMDGQRIDIVEDVENISEPSLNDSMESDMNKTSTNNISILKDKKNNGDKRASSFLLGDQMFLSNKSDAPFAKKKKKQSIGTATRNDFSAFRKKSNDHDLPAE